jgi:flavin reductase (DIM6/NTAB) family NADH-FMN oxidoreductase RutF
MVTEISGVPTAAKPPRTGMIAIIRDKETGYINASPYSGGVVSMDPYMVVFGAKARDTKLALETTDDLVVSLAAKGQLNDMYIMGNSIPHGISEIDVAGLTGYALPDTDVPGVKEFPINLKCKIRRKIDLGRARRTIVVAEVTGVSMDVRLTEMTRREVVNTVPMHEALLRHPRTKTYAPGVVNSDLRPVAGVPGNGKSSGYKFEGDANGKVYIGKDQFHTAPYEDIFVKALVPQPNIVVNTNNEDGSLHSFTITGGLLMHTPPAVQVPFRITDRSFQNIKRTGRFTVALPVTEVEKEFLALRKAGGSLGGTGFTPDKTGFTDVPGIKEIPLNMECTVDTIAEIPGTDYVLVIANKVGIYASLQTEREAHNGFVDYFPRLIYTVMDYGMTERFGSVNEFLELLPLPTLGSRNIGLWFTGPEQHQAGFAFWLYELLNSAYINQHEYLTIMRWIVCFRYEGAWAPEPLRGKLRDRITTALRLMTHAHRDEEKWYKVHDFFARIDEEENRQKDKNRYWDNIRY